MLFSNSEFNDFIDTVPDSFCAKILALISEYNDTFLSNIKSHIVFNQETHTFAVVVALARELLLYNDQVLASFQIRDYILDFIKSVLSFDDWFYIEQMIDFYDEYCRMDFFEEECYPRFIWVSFLNEPDREKRIKDNMSAIPYWRMFSIYCDILPNPKLAIDGNIYGYYQSGELTKHDPYLSHCYTKKTVNPLMQSATEFSKKVEIIIDSK